MTAKVLPFPGRPLPVRRQASPDFDALTAALILRKHRQGDLPEAVLVALLAGVGLGVPK